MLLVLFCLAAVGLCAPLNVYLLPHSHCDAGWLFTPNHYFYQGEPGSHYPVADMLDTITQELYNNPSLRFVWAETIWVQMWWDTIATAAQKDIMRTVVARKQLEFVGGGWVMNDETMATYSDVIDQVTTGHEFLRSVLGDNARVRHGWQIDMFSGYSGVTPSLWALAGYNASVIRWEGTTDMHNIWAPSQSFEFMWRASASLPTQTAEMFTHIINGNYGDLMGQVGLYWEFSNTPAVNASNVAAFAQKFATWLIARVTVFQGPLLAVWGKDFMFGQAGVEFGNMTQIVNYLNAHPELGINIQYTTLANYFDALYAFATTSNVTFPIGSPVNFTDSSNDFEYGWPHKIGGVYNETTRYQTGCISSIPEFKQLIRQRGAGQRATEIAFATATAFYGESASYQTSFDTILQGRRAMGVVQHHDAVSGTMATKWSLPSFGYDDVLTNYTNILNVAAAALDPVFTASLSAIVSGAGGISGPLSTTKPPPIKEMLTPVVLYNSLEYARNEAVKIDVSDTNVCVLDGAGQPVTAQVNTPSMELWFIGSVPALGYATYYLDTSKCSATVIVDATRVNSSAPSLELKTEHLSARFDPKTGNLIGILEQHDRTYLGVQQSANAYINGTGGAYVLVEDNQAVPLPPPVFVTSSIGPVVQEVCQVYATNIQRHCSRLFTGADRAIASIVESDFLLGPLEMRTELITRLKTDLVNATLYNDDSGMEMHARPYHSNISIGANFHVAVHCALLTPAHDPRQLAVLVSHSMGMSSLVDGTVDFMIHRRMNTSDSQGPWPLNDTDVATGKLWLLASTPRSISLARHRLSLSLQYPIIVTYAQPIGFPDFQGASWSALQTSFPPNVRIQAFFIRANSTLPVQPEYVLRLHHLVESGDGPLAVPANISLASLFNGPTVSNVTPMTITLQQPLSALVRRQWPIRSGAAAAASSSSPAAIAKMAEIEEGIAGGSVVLQPLEFATLSMGISK